MTDGPQDTGEYRAPGGPAPDQPTGGHPIKAVIGGIVALWLVLWLVIPNPKDQPVDPRTGMTERTPGMTSGTSNVPHVTSRAAAVLPEFNAAAVLVPPDTTNEQVAHLLQRLNVPESMKHSCSMCRRPAREIGLDPMRSLTYISSLRTNGPPRLLFKLWRRAHTERMESLISATLSGMFVDTMPLTCMRRRIEIVDH